MSSDLVIRHPISFDCIVGIITHVKVLGGGTFYFSGCSHFCLGIVANIALFSEHIRNLGMGGGNFKTSGRILKAEMRYNCLH